MSFRVERYIGETTLNGTECLLDSKGNVMSFTQFNDAVEFLKSNGLSDDEIEELIIIENE